MQTQLVLKGITDIPVKASDLYIGGSHRNHVERSPKVSHIVTHPKHKMVFILTEKKTIAIHRSNTFAINPREVRGNLWERRYYKIRSKIIERKICTIYDLLGECRNGMDIVPAKLEWYV